MSEDRDDSLPPVGVTMYPSGNFGLIQWHDGKARELIIDVDGAKELAETLVKMLSAFGAPDDA